MQKGQSLSPDQRRQHSREASSPPSHCLGIAEPLREILPRLHQPLPSIPRQIATSAPLILGDIAENIDELEAATVAPPQPSHFLKWELRKTNVTAEADLGPEYPHTTRNLIAVVQKLLVGIESDHLILWEVGEVPALPLRNCCGHLSDRSLLPALQARQPLQDLPQARHENSLAILQSLFVRDGSRRLQKLRIRLPRLLQLVSELRQKLLPQGSLASAIRDGIAGSREEIAHAHRRAHRLGERAQGEIEGARNVPQHIPSQLPLSLHSHTRGPQLTSPPSRHQEELGPQEQRGSPEEIASPLSRRSHPSILPLLVSARYHCAVTGPPSLYVHLPFCHRICPYCSFYKHTPGDTDFTRFVSTLLLEARRRAEELGHPKFRTAYFGGGTPSLLSEKHLRHLLEGLHEVLDFSEIEEMDFEANPMTFQLPKARLFRELGVTRVSLGVQSFQEDELRALGRDHSAAQAKASFEMLREAGIPSCNLDLMFSVPHQTEASWSQSLEQAIALQPDHISCYNLTYEEDTAYFEQFQKGELGDDPELNEKLFTLAHEQLTGAGFRHYETSNYGNPGHLSKHNLSYWEGRSYLGLGPSAVSTINQHEGGVQATRWKNTPDTASYLSQINAVGHAMCESERLTEEQYHLERIALLLRTDTGLPMRYLPTGCSLDLLLEHQLARIQDEHLILSREGALLVDAIAAELMN